MFGLTVDEVNNEVFELSLGDQYGGILVIPKLAGRISKGNALVVSRWLKMVKTKVDVGLVFRNLINIPHPLDEERKGVDQIHTIIQMSGKSFLHLTKSQMDFIHQDWVNKLLSIETEEPNAGPGVVKSYD